MRGCVVTCFCGRHVACCFRRWRVILDGMSAPEESVVTCLLPHPCFVATESNVVFVSSHFGHKLVLSRELVCFAVYLSARVTVSSVLAPTSRSLPCQWSRLEAIATMGCWCLSPSVVFHPRVPGREVVLMSWPWIRALRTESWISDHCHGHRLGDTPHGISVAAVFAISAAPQVGWAMCVNAHNVTIDRWLQWCRFSCVSTSTEPLGH